MNYITIYKVIDRDDDSQVPSYYKGIEQLREFGKYRIFNGWDTDTEEYDLDDDTKLFNFLENDYGVDISVVAQVSLSDFKTDNAHLY